MLLRLLSCSLFIAAVCADICTLTQQDGTEIPWGDTSPIAAVPFTKNLTGLVLQLNLQGAAFQSQLFTPPCKSQFFKFNNGGNVISYETEMSPTDWDTAFLRTSQDSIRCSSTVVFNTSACDNVSDSVQKTVEFSVVDVNLVEPAFNEKTYLFEVPFPLGKGVSLDALLSKPFFAQDTDFSTQQLTFNLNDPNGDFELVVGSNAEKKFDAHLVAKQLVFLDGPVDFIATVTDDAADGTKSGSATFRIEPTSDTPPKQPQFDAILVEVADGEIGTIKLTGAYSGDLSATTDNENFTAQVIEQDQVYSVQVSILPPHSLEMPTAVRVDVTNTRSGQQSTGSAVVFFALSGTTTTTTTTEHTTTTTTEHTTTTTTEQATSPPINTDPIPTTTSDPGGEVEGDGDETSEDVGLLVATIILAVLSACLLAVIYFGYKKHVQKKGGKNKNQIRNNFDNEGSAKPTTVSVSPAPTIVIQSEKSLLNIEELDDERSSKEDLKSDTIAEEVEEKTESAEIDNAPGDQLEAAKNDERTRKRSMTFSEDDGKARQFREKESESFSSGTESITPAASQQPNNEASQITNF